MLGSMPTKTTEYILEVLAADTEQCVEWPFARDPNGYGRMTTNNPTGSSLAHRVVCYEAHGAPVCDETAVLHLCNNPPCVNPRHLRWGTQAENIGQAARDGRMVRGSMHYTTHFTDSDVVTIRKRYADGGCSLRSLAAEYDVTNAAIEKIVKRRTWRHV